MEEHKLRYLRLLLQRKNESTADIFVSAVGELCKEAQKCYAEPINLSDSKFIEMMVLDGCFIIELVRKSNMECLRDRNDVLFGMEWITSSLQRDLMLFENQIPFFVLRKLFELIEIPRDTDERLICFLLKFFGILYPESRYTVSISKRPDQEIKHLLHLIHINWHPTSDSLPIDLDETIKENKWKCFQFRTAANVKKKETWKFIQSAGKLREANVKFKRSESNSFFKIEFENGVLSLPHLIIEDRTEDFFRNVIAYEQYLQDKEIRFVTDYVKFMDCLIDSSRDVEILRHRGIIESWLGDDEMIANMFNKLTESVTGPGERFIYAGTCTRVNKHFSKRKNWWMKILRLRYCDSPWKVISVVAATLLLLLTFIQTVCSIKQPVSAPEPPSWAGMEADKISVAQDEQGVVEQLRYDYHDVFKIHNK
ncbi:hypothetical protein BUALT_BualtUnG0022300 [Buddleja alternifolia]|uniref:Uncharacterized protein n=1 Tax=Buddleja alternifolia TaxID=168488 RepID=A0AAV6W0J3_9LAMI|nr:hypothetical protein BUALT_BualtUnG0022300 [Buddleja alternifolia]